MKIPFSKNPGRHERHFRRKLDNPLFPRPVITPGDEDLLEVQRLDHEELIELVNELRNTVKQAVELKPNEESQVVLDLKGRMERLYEQACTVAEEQEVNKSAIRRLIDVILTTVRRGAEGDPLAMQELNDEEQARATHFQLLEQPLVADLVHPESVLAEDELLPALLSEPVENLPQVLSIFDREQVGALVMEGRKLIENTRLEGAASDSAGQALAAIEQALADQSPLN